MANFNLTYTGAIGATVAGLTTPRIVLASMGGALLKRVLEQPGTPPGATDPLNDQTHVIRVAHFDAISPDDYGTASVDWTSYTAAIDEDGEIAVQIEDPDFTAADPCPTLTAWAIELGGTVQGTQAHP